MGRAEEIQFRDRIPNEPRPSVLHYRVVLAVRVFCVYFFASRQSNYTTPGCIRFPRARSVLCSVPAHSTRPSLCTNIIALSIDGKRLHGAVLRKARVTVRGGGQNSVVIKSAGERDGERWPRVEGKRCEDEKHTVNAYTHVCACLCERAGLVGGIVFPSARGHRFRTQDVETSARIGGSAALVELMRFGGIPTAMGEQHVCRIRGLVSGRDMCARDIRRKRDARALERERRARKAAQDVYGR